MSRSHLLTFIHRDDWRQLPRPVFLLALSDKSPVPPLPRCDWLLLLGHAGRITFFSAGNEFSLEAGQAQLLDCTDQPCMQPINEGGCVIFGFKGGDSFVRELLDGLPACNSLPINSGAAIRLQDFLELNQSQIELSDLDGIMLVLGTLAGLLQHHENANNDPPKMIRLACRLLEQNVEQPYDGNALANQLGMSPNYFITCFTEVMGVSPGQYHKRLRLTRAAQLLKGSHLPIQAIAERLGYGTTSTFARAFRSIYHMSPQQYRDHASVPLQ